MKLIAPLTVAVALLGTGVFFAVQNLDRADKYASVASFLLALAIAGVTLVIHLRRRGKPADSSSEPQRIYHIDRAGTVFTEQVRTAHVTTVRGKAGKKGRRSP